MKEEMDDPFADVMNEQFPDEDENENEVVEDDEESGENLKESEVIEQEQREEEVEEQFGEDDDEDDYRPKKGHNKGKEYNKTLIKAHAIRRLIHEKGFKLSLDYLDELDKQVEKLIDESLRRMKHNDRKVLRAGDA